jgi:hypothetical protein
VLITIRFTIAKRPKYLKLTKTGNKTGLFSSKSEWNAIVRHMVGCQAAVVQDDAQGAVFTSTQISLANVALFSLH